MINDNELKIANKSYTNKDFATIYPELLDLAKKLTNTWDPSISNESDPGVVLLKLNAFIADKINYNIDKNILEAFMPSATQMSSMRNLCEVNGYNPKYYRSATTDITFMYLSALAENDSFTLPKFSTVITNDKNTIVYTMIQDVTITEKNIAYTLPAIEGTIVDLATDNNSLIELNNLDDNNRVYLPETMVAENGIFISNAGLNNYAIWKRVDNLNTIALGNTIYKFGFDSNKGLPYIEFPIDISELIKSGLNIKYIQTSGDSGNVKAQTLIKRVDGNSITTTLGNTLTDLGTNLIISNAGAASNGANPETINEAYNSFKKTVGTFDTLVTRRDYANTIYNLEDTNSKPMVSNVAVSDRTTDINNALNVITFDDYGQYNKLKTVSTNMNAFQLCLYPLKAIKTGYTKDTYNSSFKASSVSDLNLIKSDPTLSDYKTISHDYKTLASTDIYCLKNYYTLNAKISTYNKVSKNEQIIIKDNILLALYKAFNAREVDYGYEIPFDTLLSVIQNADTRIKNVSLDEPIYETEVMKADELHHEVALLSEDGKEYLKKILAKNVLAGKISLFEYDNLFPYDFGQLNTTTVTRLVSANTQSLIPLTVVDNVASLDNFVLRENESVQIISPNLTTTITYPAFTNYLFLPADAGKVLLANEEYKLQSGDIFRINYTDSKGIEQNILYPVGQIIRPNFSLVTYANDTHTHISKTINIAGQPTVINFRVLGTNDTIDIRKVIETEISDVSVPCYWITDTNEFVDDVLYSKIPWTTIVVDGVTYSEYILKENEYFIYSNAALSDLVLLGMGTKLSLKGAQSSDWLIKKINIDTVSDKGTGAFDKNDWKYLDFSGGGLGALTVNEMQIVTLPNGSALTIAGLDVEVGVTSLTNNYMPVNSDAVITYKSSDSNDVITLNKNCLGWYIHSRLNIDSSPTKPQYLSRYQKITLTYLDISNVSHDVSIEGSMDGDDYTGVYLAFNTAITLLGGSNVDLSVLSSLGITYDVGCYYYSFTKPSFIIDGVTTDLTRINGYLTMDGLNITNSISKILTLPFDFKTLVSPATYIIPLYIAAANDTIPSGGLVALEGMALVDGTKYKLNFNKYNSGNASTANYNLTAGMNLVEVTISNITTNVTYPAGLKITMSASASNIMDTVIINVGNIQKIENINSKLTQHGYVTSAELLAEIKTLMTADSGIDDFYYTCTIDNSSDIEADDLTSPEALWDVNNVTNTFTIAELDIDASKIEIAKTSMM